MDETEIIDSSQVSPAQSRTVRKYIKPRLTENDINRE